jgi:anti-sigma factor RsiW
MRCDKVVENLEDYAAGLLDSEAAGAVTQHLEACAACAGVLALLSAEESAYREYRGLVDRNLGLRPGMWPSVLKGLEQQPARTGFWRQSLLAAALIVLSVGATLLAVRYYEVRKPERASTLEQALQSIQNAEREYTDAIQILSQIVDRKKQTMDPQLIAELEANLKAIDENIAVARKAYHEHPADAELAHYMLAAYSRKVELLQELAS